MNEELIKESVSDYGYFERLRGNVGYSPTTSLTDDWTRGAARSLANESSAQDDDFFNSLIFAPFDADARTTFLINMNEGQLMDDKDRMIVANRNRKRVDNLLSIIQNEDLNSQDVLKLVASNENYIGLLRDGKFDSSDVTENINKLKQIKDEAANDYDDAFEDYQTDLKDIERWKNSHTVSGYYTRKSQQKSKLGNWFYTEPATNGLSSSSWKEQASSFAAGFSTSLAIAKGAAMAGLAAGPQGSAAGAVLGLIAGVGGAIVDQLAGGSQAREQESHMEAYSAYQDKLLKLMSEKNLDLHTMANNIREQAKDLGYPDLSEITDQDIVGMAAADKRFTYDFDGGYALAQAMDDAYIGTRRVYERNNALGAAEFATDILMYTPLRGIAAAKLSKGVQKLNPINYLQNAVRKTNLDIAELAGKLRLRAIKHYGGGILKRKGLDFIEEGTEEGAQSVIQSEFQAGKYDTEQASDEFTDAVFNGNILSDMWDNLIFRTESGLSFLGLGSKYKNDLQMQEEIWAGGLLSLLSPQGAAMTAKNFHETYKGIKQAYGMGKFIEESLSNNADTNGIETFFRNMRKYDFANYSDYSQVLDFLREELKSAKTSKDGHTTRRWKIDTDAIHKIIGPINRNLKDEDGNPVKPQTDELTDEHIDQYIDYQAKLAQILFTYKNQYLDKAWKRIKGGITTDVPVKGHTVEELNHISKRIDDIQKQIEDPNTGNEIKKALQNELKKLKRDYKKFSKTAIDTDMQDAYYAIAAMGFYQRELADNKRDETNKKLINTQLSLRQQVSNEHFANIKKSLGLSQEVPNDLLFSILWSNQNMYNIRMSRAKIESDYIASHREALHGNAPIALSEQQRKALDALDELIEINQKEHDILTNEVDKLDITDKDKLVDLLKYGNSSAAQFAATDDVVKHDKGLGTIFTNAGISPEDTIKYISARDEGIMSKVTALQAKRYLDELLHGEPSAIKELIRQYRKAKKESFQSQQAFDRQQKTGKEQDQSKYSSLKKWLEKATETQIGERIDEIDTNLTRNIQKFDSFVSNLPASSPLYEPLNKALQFANAIQEAANGSKQSKVRALQYQLMDLRKQFKDSTDPNVQHALELVDSLIKDIIDINVLNNEAAARQFRYSVPGKYVQGISNPLKVDNRTFTDDEGNLYNVNISRSTYSELNGLELVLEKNNSQVESEKRVLEEQKNGIQKTIERLSQDLEALSSDKSEAVQKIVESLSKQIDQYKKALKETEEAINNLEVDKIFNVQYGDEMLDKIYYKENDGTKVTLNKSYEHTNKVLKERAEAERSRRLTNPGISSVQYRNVAEITGRYAKQELVDLEEQNEEAEIKRAIAYALGDTNSKKIAAVLSSPYYSSRDWNGFFSYTMNEKVVDNWSTVTAARKRQIKSAIKNFNQLVEQAAHLKSVNRKDVLKKFLDDVDAMLQKPVNEQKPEDTVTLESSDPAQPKYAVKLNRVQLMEIIRFLPMQAYLRNKNYGKGEKAGKLYIPLVLADLKDEQNAYNEDGKFTTKFQWRYAMVKSFLQQAHNRKKEEEQAVNEEEQRDNQHDNMEFDINTGYDARAEEQNKRDRKEKKYSATIHIPAGSIDITFEKYNQKFENPQFNPESPLFYDAQGKRIAPLPETGVLTPQQLTEMYIDKIQNMLSTMNSDAVYSKFADELSKILDTQVTVEDLRQLIKKNKDSDPDITVLEKIILDGVRYGDGVILRDSVANSLKELLGSFKYSTTTTALQSIEKSNKIDSLFNLIQDEFHNLFLSYKNQNLQQGTKQTVTGSQIATYKQLGRFTKTGDIKTRQPGSVQVLIEDEDGNVRTLGSTRNPVHTSDNKVAEMLNTLDDAIDAVSTPEEFFRDYVEKMPIKFEFTPTPGADLTTEQKTAAAMDLISRYIRNRHYGRLPKVSSFTDMLISGTDHPNNSPVANKRFFAQKGQVINSRINDIDSLHIKEADGVFYFDLEEFASKSTRQQETDEQGNVTTTMSDLEAEKKQIEDTRKEVVDKLDDLRRDVENNKKRLIKEIIQYLKNNHSVYSQYKTFENLYNENGDIVLYDESGKQLTKKDGSLKSKVKREDVFNVIDDIISSLDKEFKQLQDNVSQKLVETLQSKAAETNEPLSENGKHARVQFAVGSYNERTGKARLLRGDGSGNYIAINEAVGQPGGVYLIIPAFMNASGKRRVVHLNGRKLAVHQATFIAKLLDAVRTGKVNYNGNIPSNAIEGYNIDTNVTVNELLDALIHIGTKSIENDSSASAFGSLLFVGANGEIHFGSNVLNDDNLSDLITFLQDKKQIRVDRAKLLNDNASVGISANIQLTDDSEFKKSGLVKDSDVFTLDAEENYQHYVIDKGVVRSDLNPDKGARMYNGVVVAIDTPFTGNDAIPNPNSTKNSNSAESMQRQVTESFIPTEMFAQQVNAPIQPSEQVAQSVAIERTSSSVPDGYTRIIHDANTIKQSIAQQASKQGIDISDGYFILADGNAVDEEYIAESMNTIKATTKKGKPRISVKTKLLVANNQGENFALEIPILVEAPKRAPVQQTPVQQVSPQPVQVQSPQPFVQSPDPFISSPGPSTPSLSAQPQSQPTVPKFSLQQNASTGAIVTSTSQVAPAVNTGAMPVTTTPTNLSEQVIDTILNNPHIFNNFTASNIEEVSESLKANILNYFTSQGIITYDNFSQFITDYENSEKLGTLVAKYTEYLNNRSVKYGQALDFLSKYVEKEDYKTAQSRAIRMLGNPDIRFTSDLPFTFDTNRRAYIYVFGQCSEAFMTIYRSAKGQVAKGVMDHEAFHRISLFVLSKKERDQLYADIRKAYPETQGMTDQQVEEFAADLFKDFVDKYSAQGKEGFYSDNKFIRFFQKLYDYGAKMMRKLFGLRTHPNYRGIDKLFEDMYSGRYAYAKATKDNLELFNAIFDTAPMSGISHRDGTIVAKTITERNQILRTLISRIVDKSGILDTVNNYTDMDKAMESIKADLLKDRDGLGELIKTAFTKGDFDEVVRANNLRAIYDLILEDNCWKAWKEIVNDTLRMSFKITKQKVDPNQSLSVLEDPETDTVYNDNQDPDTEDTSIATTGEIPAEPVEDDFTMGFSGFRDSLQVNTWNSSALSVKLLFYSIVSEDSRNNKKNANGMFNYANPTQMYLKFTELLQDCISEEEMMKVLEQNLSTMPEVQSVYEHLKITKDDNEHSATAKRSLQNKFFTSVCRYQHNFENNVYEVTEPETDKEGKVTRPMKVIARSANGNIDEVASKVRKVVMSSMIEALAERSRMYTGSNKYNAKENKENIEKQIKKLESYTTIDNIRKQLELVLSEMYKVNGFGMLVEGDSNLKQSVDIIMRSITIGGNIKNELTTLTNVLRIINENVTGLTTENILDEETSIRQRLQGIIDKNANLQNFFKNINRYMPRQPKSMSQNGPKNVRIYTIGAFNYISRLFKLWTKKHNNQETNWKQYVRNNPYAEHSIWLDKLEDSKMNTRLQTMTEGDYANAKSDKFAFAKEEYINRMVTVLEMDSNGEWLGNHAFPVLANKKFSADLQGIVVEGLKQPVSINIGPKGIYVSINNQAKEIFAGYFLDELKAIRQAEKVRDEFIDTINKTLGTNYTIESFSKLSVSEQRDLFNATNLEETKRSDAINSINEAIKKLTVTYHFKSTKTEPVRDNKGRIVSFNDAHIDLRKGSGYKHRHFQKVANALKDANINLDTLKKEDSRLQKIIEDQVLLPNIQFAERDMLHKGALRYIPNNLIEGFKKKYSTYRNNDDAIKKAMIATFVIRHMSDMLEYEKLVQGDMAYYGDGSSTSSYRKTVDKMTKRYSGPVSTFGLNASKGTMEMSLSIDKNKELIDSDTYNVLTVQTTKLIDYDVHKGLIEKSLGIPVQITYNEDLENAEVTADIDYKQLLDENGEIKKQVLEGSFSPYKMFIEVNGHEAVAKLIVNDVLNRYKYYLSQDYTDATTWISPAMFREARQRSDDGWTLTEEACYLFMEHYDELHKLTGNDLEVMKKNAKLLGISDEEFELMVIHCRNIYGEHSYNTDETWNGENHREVRRRYRGWILSFLENEDGTPKIDTTPLKYIHYGNRPQDGTSVLYIPVYDKTALEPLFKIYTEDHDAEQMYKLMNERNIHVLKLDSSTKSGGVFGYQLYDNKGNFNQDLYNAPSTQQWFAQLSKQLDTDMHTHNDASLLTQLTKVVMLNTVNHNYNFGGETVSGKDINRLYSQVFNSLTKDGFNKFLSDFGFNEDGTLSIEGRQKLVQKFKEILEESGASQSVINAFELDEKGEFITSPALLPSMNQMQSRLLSQIGKIIVDTHIKGVPLYQIVSAGFDKDHPLKKENAASFDEELLSPGDIDPKTGKVVTRMQARVSIMLFNDVINKAKKNKALSKKYNDFKNFEDKRAFLLDNKDQISSLAYRVPTQGQNSTIAIEIVDILPSTQGGIIQLPTTLTALTGADFDIDKLFTATYNYEVTDKGIERVDYRTEYKTVEDLINHIDQLSTKQKENLLLDIYQTVLTSNNNLLHTATSLDVCTEPVKKVMTTEIIDDAEKNESDGLSLNPAHQVQMRVQNSGSDSTIGPMALNSVFQYFTQVCDLGFINDPQLEKIGITGFGMEYIASSDLKIYYILDITSAMINAAVDAAKDNYIGRSNINSETFDVVNFLIAGGFGHNAFRFLAQPGVKDYVDSLLNASKDSVFREKAEIVEVGNFKIKPELFTEQALKKNLDGNDEDAQKHYVAAYAYIKAIAQRYRQAITVAQVDTKKYGKNITELMAFLQNVEDYNSVYNLLFSNPNNLFDQTFLKEKLNSVQTAMDAFSDIFLENSKTFKQVADKLCTVFNKKGQFSKQFLRRAVPKIKQAVFKGFFDQYIINRFPNADGTINISCLHTLFADRQKSVIARYDDIKNLCIQEGIGTDFFSMITHSPIRKKSSSPMFFIVNNTVTNDPITRQAVTDSIAELFHSKDARVRQWITDVAVMQFYQTGGTDASFGTSVRTTFYDVLPLKELANIEAYVDGQLVTFNDYINQKKYADNIDSLVNQTILQLSISDDEYVKVFKTYGKSNQFGMQLSGDGNVAVFKKHGMKARTDRLGARYAKYVKIKTSRTSTPDLYVLGNVMQVYDEKADRTYTNPVYFRMSTLGYTQYSNRSARIRVDGAYYNGSLISLFNSQNGAKLKDQNKYVLFNATNLQELERFAASEDIKQKTKGTVTIYQVDELGNVMFTPTADPYNGMFEINPKNTNVVLSRLEQAPSQYNMDYINRAKEVGATFQQLVKQGDKYVFIGSNTELKGQVSLFANSMEDVNVASFAIFNKYPGVTGIKFIGDTGVEIMTRSDFGKSKEKSKIVYSSIKYSRGNAESNQRSLYIFTDNWERTSGGNEYGDSWYKQKYGKGGYGTSGNPTTAVVRGLPNAAPISTMKAFSPKNIEAARMNDSDIDQVRKILNDELADIKRLWNSGKFDRIVLPNEDFLLNSSIAKITEDRTPQLYELMQDAIKQIKEMVADTEVSRKLKQIEDNKDSEEQQNKKC